MAAPQREDTPITPNVGGLVLVGDAPTVRISPLFEALLNSAGQLLKDGHPSAAVLVAQTAIEVCTERIVSKFIAARGATFLSKWIDDRLDNYNIFNEAVRRLYQALSSDAALVNQGFWTSSRLKNHVELRNDIAHEGRQASLVEAQASVKVAREAIQYQPVWRRIAASTWARNRRRAPAMTLLHDLTDFLHSHRPIDSPRRPRKSEPLVRFRLMPRA